MTNSSTELLDLRRQKLHQLVLHKYGGRRAAMARATDIHPNQINLMLSENIALRRPVTDHWARKIEEALGLGPGWFDIDEEGMVTGTNYTIRCFQVPDLVAQKFSACHMLHSLVATPHFLKRFNVVDPKALVFTEVLTDEMSPDISIGDQVVLELFPIPEPKKKAPLLKITLDGIYVLRGANNVVKVRNVSRGLDGNYHLTSPNASSTPSEVLPNLKGIHAVGRVVTTLKFS